MVFLLLVPLYSDLEPKPINSLKMLLCNIFKEFIGSFDPQTAVIPILESVTTLSRIGIGFVE
ncbi:hypothetical protein APA_2685 [Pseudanabaena sp. lw0831]|nr:hypothetical protein APA_2685 [Pseudanabaena sp. lw0831]